MPKGATLHEPGLTGRRWLARPIGAFPVFRVSSHSIFCRLTGTAVRRRPLPLQGQIRLSLVSIPVELFSATKTTEKIAFRQIHEPSGKPIHYQKVVAGIGPVDVDDIVMGFV